MDSTQQILSQIPVQDTVQAPPEVLISKLIAFSSDASGNDKYQIFIMYDNGDSLKQLSFLDLDCYTPRFSPDGRKIVFHATNVISDYLYLIDLDDSSGLPSPKFIDGGIDPVFSEDGNYLLYRSEKNEDNAIYITDLETDSSDMISDGSLSAHAEFSSDGSKVIYTSSANGNMDLVVIDMDDTTENSQKAIAMSDDAEIYGTFSPDGKLVAYASFDINYKGTVHICGSDGSSNLTIPMGKGSSYNPKFSPDSKQLAFVSERSGNFEVYICNTDGSGLKQLTNKDGDTMGFDWSSDGKAIIYENKNESVSSINVVDIESGKTENLTGSNANNINPSFQK
ncbi:MAG: hypothetical protein ACRDFC_10555 [Ignavibacteria bacterium]